MRPHKIQTAKGHLTLIEPGIIKFTLKEDVEWTLEDAIETHEANMKLGEGRPFCLLMKANKFFIPTKEAQKFVTSRECTKYRLGAAFIIENKAVQLFASLFIKLFKSSSPIRIFNSEDKAMKWMRKIYQEASRIPS